MLTATLAFSSRTALHGRRVHRYGGYSLMEIAMVLAIIALLIAGTMLFFSTASHAERYNQLTEELGAVLVSVHNLYGNQPAFTGLSGAVLANSGLLPAKWVAGSRPNATGLMNPLGGPITVYADAAQSANFDVLLVGLSVADCQKIAMLAFGDVEFGVVVNEETYSAVGMPISQAQTYCNRAANTIRWAFF